MASKASLHAYVAFGCIIWFAEELRQKHEKENQQLFNDTVHLKQLANNAAQIWEDILTRKQIRRLREELKKVFDREADLLEVGCMLLAALEDMKEYLKPEKKRVVEQIAKQLYLILTTYYDQDKEWNVYSSSLRALERFNQILDQI